MTLCTPQEVVDESDEDYEVLQILAVVESSEVVDACNDVPAAPEDREEEKLDDHYLGSNFSLQVDNHQRGHPGKKHLHDGLVGS